MHLFTLPAIHEIPDFLPLFPFISFSFGLGVYLAWTILLYLMARKTEHKAHAWIAFVPILHFALVFKLGKLSPWLAILMLVPGINWILLALAYYNIVKQAGKPWWWTALLFVNPVSIVIMIMLVNAYEEKLDPSSGTAFDGNMDPFTQKTSME